MDVTESGAEWAKAMVLLREVLAPQLLAEWHRRRRSGVFDMGDEADRREHARASAQLNRCRLKPRGFAVRIPEGQVALVADVVHF